MRLGELQNIETTLQLKKFVSKLPNSPVDYKVAVSSFIFTKKDKLLLLERGKAAKESRGKLEGIGGLVKDSEKSLHEALIKEIQEEIGPVKIEVSGMMSIKILPGKTNAFWVIVNYLCRLTDGTPRIMDTNKVKNIHYIKLGDIDDKKLSTFKKETLDNYRKKFKNKPFYK